MPNNYFRFKRFTVHQNKSSMKVCTDSCIFGAWLAKRNLPAKNCLELGTGTGLLSLMYAQKNNDCRIDALEIEENACAQASENFNDSEWKSHLNLICIDANNYISNKKYDLIFSNPPFFQQELLSFEKNKNLAKHNDGLMLVDLLNIIQKLLLPTGYFCLLLPPERAQYFHKLAFERSFFLQEKLMIKHNNSKKYIREILLYSRRQTTTIESELIIKDDDGNYTKEFKDLLMDYYLLL